VSRRVSDLMNDDGTVDTDKVRAIQNRGGGCEPEVTAQECNAWRRRLVDCPNVDPVADRVDFSGNTVAVHVTGDCVHDCEHPPLQYRRDYERGGGVWVIDS